ncbi:hybrid sensor histidine kinase/response regulator [Aquabacterium humicola]|uniref:hybrid sensor histidine kinase/response regulator n=1 Tax=Aquabacterium humicola TaxID=3237377 RepID=UPI002543F911|nr:ATP-binding protein [Rubrivivax pictus]
MKGWSVKARVATLLLLLLALLGTAGGLALLRLERAVSTLDSVYRDRLVPVQLLNGIVTAYRGGIVTDLQHWRDGSVAPADAAHRIATTTGAIRVDWQAYLGTFMVPQEQALLGDAEQRLAAADAAIARLATPGRPAPSAADMRELAEVLRPLDDVLQRLIQLQLVEARTQSAAAVASSRQALWAAAALGALALFGGMLVAWAVVSRHLKERAEVEARERRLQSFYRALQRTNQLIVRTPDQRTLFAELTRICVETGHARLACVHEQEGQVVYRRELQGSQVALFDGFPDRFDFDRQPEYRATLVGEALQNDRHTISNDYLDSRYSVRWRDRVREYGIGAAAAFVLRRAGTPVATLSLFAGEADFFDDALVQLLDEMAGEVSFALDNEQRERARQQAERALREREQRLAGIVDSAMDAVITIDDQQRIKVFNAAAGRVFGIEPSAAIGLTLDRFIPEASRAVHARLVHDFARDGSQAAHMGGGVRAVTALRADGTAFPVEASIARHAGGDEVLMTAFVRDVTERRQAEHARAAQAAAESANRAKSEFLANMSHEIRTPMNAILGLTDLVLRTPLTPRQADYVGKSRLAAQALLGLIDQILDFSKIEAGRLELESRAFALDEVLEVVRVIVGERVRQRGLQFRVDVASDVPAHVVGDSQRLAQVLINLGGNAAKFTEQGEVALAVSGAGIEGDRVRLRFAVSDTGIGMDAATLDRLFRPFAQADASTARRFGGSGLGLAISKQLVELMGGHIAVDSTPGRGSTFSFTVALGLANGAAATAAATLPTGALAGRRVLLVEDNEFNQIVAGELLREVAGVDVTVAGDGPEALRQLGQKRFDAMLLDVQMPGMDGYEVARRVRAGTDHAGLPIIALTAHASVADRELCLAAGMNDFLTKPFEPAALLRLLGRWLEPGGEAGAAPSAATAQVAAGGVDFALGLTHCLGRPPLYERVLRRFSEIAEGPPQRLEAALAAGDTAAAALVAHSLISTAATVGAQTLSDLARELEAAIIGGETARWPGLSARLRAEHERATAAVAAYLAQTEPA